MKADIPDPTAATSEANRLVGQEKLQVLLGTFAAPLGVAVSAVAAKEGVVHWEAFAGADIITKRGSKWIFRNGAPSSFYGLTMVDAVRDVVAPKLGADLKALRIGTLWENRPWGSGVVEGIRARAKELGLPLHLDEGDDQFATDVTPIVQKLKDAGQNLRTVVPVSQWQNGRHVALWPVALALGEPILLPLPPWDKW